MIKDIYNLFAHTVGLHQSLIQSQVEKKFPHFQIEGFVKTQYEIKSMNGEEEDNIYAYQKYYKQQNLVVFDSLRQRKIMIVVYIMAFLSDNQLSEIEYLIENFRKIDHIFLEHYDTYFLSEDKNYFAVEMEWCEMTMIQFQKDYQFTNQQMSHLMKCFEEYLKGQYCYNQHHFNVFDLELFVKIIDKTKIMIKINILSLSNQEKYCKNHIYQFDLNFQYKFLMEIEEQGQIFQQQFIEFQDRLRKQILIETFQEEIKQSYSYLLDNYNLDVFERISKNPQYKTIQVNSYLNNCQQFLIENNKQQKLILEVYKTNSYQETQQLTQEIQQSTNKQLKNSKYNMINIDVFQTEKESYILIEKQMLVQDSKLITFETPIENTFLEQGRLFSLDFIILKNIITLSEDLFLENDLQMTKINPSKIFINLNNKQENNQKQIMIDQLTFTKDYTQAYMSIINQIFMREIDFYTESELNKIIFYQQIQKYISAIQLNQKERAYQLYLSVQQHLKKLDLIYFAKDVKIINSQKNLLSLSLSLYEIETMTKLFEEVNKQYNLGSPIQISQACTNQNIKNIFEVGEQLQFQEIKINTWHNQIIQDISFLNFEVFKSVQELSLVDSCNFRSIKQFNQFKNINKILIFRNRKRSLFHQQTKIEASQFYKLKYLVQFRVIDQ